MDIREIPLAAIRPGNNDRKEFEGLEELARSIERNGLIQPVTVRPDPDGDGYVLIAGERRYRATKLIRGATTIRAVVTDHGDDREASLKMLAENTGRANLNPIEEAVAYRQRIDQYGLSVQELADAAGRTVAHVEWCLQLLELAPEVQRQVANGSLGTGWATALLGLDANRQRAALQLASQQKLNYDEFWALCERLRVEQATEPLFDAEAFELQAQEYVEQVRDRTLCLGIKQFAKLVDELFDGLDIDGLVEGDPHKQRLLARVRANLDYRVRGIDPTGDGGRGSRGGRKPAKAKGGGR